MLALIAGLYRLTAHSRRCCHSRSPYSPVISAGADGILPASAPNAKLSLAGRRLFHILGVYRIKIRRAHHPGVA
ncbi:hypothetical protein KCP75_21940 [Salmonella enterica subsp. enterica]|nr:hypothetical protein KCP75_21940 [Salmonella enterica subsp. enterica]